MLSQLSSSALVAQERKVVAHLEVIALVVVQWLLVMQIVDVVCSCFSSSQDLRAHLCSTYLKS